jgi:glycopeptide antibiotics resistance protein
MSASNLRHLQQTTPVLSERIDRGVRVFIFAASLLCILFATTFPFDFSIPVGTAAQMVQQRFDTRWLEWDPHHIDCVENILLFMPLGFGIASLFVRNRRLRFIRQIVAAFFFSALLSTTVEVSQTFLSYRDPSLQDIWANTTGGMAGAILFVLLGRQTIRLAAAMLVHLRVLAQPAIFAGFLAIYGIFQLSVPLLIHNPGNLNNWDPNMHLLIGNRMDRARKWSGNISQLVLADRAATSQQAMQIAQGADANSILGDSLLADYRLRGAGPYEDRSGHLPPLLWMDKNHPTLSDRSVEIVDGSGLRSSDVVAPAIQRIARSWQFTIALACASDRTDQTGPARIVTISNRSDLDLELGQESSELVIRVRTGMNYMPELRLQDIFLDRSPHRFVVTMRDATIVAYVDGQERGWVQITPEAKLIWRLYPRGGFAMRMGKFGFRIYAAIYRLLVFIPFSTLLGAMLITSDWTAATKRIVAVTVIGVMALLLEIILGTQAADGFQPRNLLISLGIGFAWLGAVSLRPTRIWPDGSARGSGKVR